MLIESSYALPLGVPYPFGFCQCVLGVLLVLARGASPGPLRDFGTAPHPFFCDLDVDVPEGVGGGPPFYDAEVDLVQVVLLAIRLVRKRKSVENR